MTNPILDKNECECIYNQLGALRSTELIYTKHRAKGSQMIIHALTGILKGDDYYA